MTYIDYIINGYKCNEGHTCTNDIHIHLYYQTHTHKKQVTELDPIVQ